MENFIWTNLRIITWETGYKAVIKLWGLFCLLEVKAQLCKFFWEKGLYVKGHIDSLHISDLHVQSE